MDADTRPSSDAVIATVDSAEDAQAIVSAITEATDIHTEAIAHGTGESFAAQLEGGDRDSAPGTRLGKWLISLGQDREELMEKGQEAREGRHVVVVNEVNDDDTKEAVVAVLQRQNAQDIIYFGEWQNEDIL
jgi:hypothetical protein